MSALFKLFLEHPVLFPVTCALQFAFYWVAMKIGIEVMVLAVKAATWAVPKLDWLAKFVALLR